MHVALLSAAAAAIAPAAAAAPLKCGVSTDKLHDCPACVATLVKTGGLDFWWNWGTEPKVDESRLSDDVKAAMRKSFVPMIWGQWSGPPGGNYDWLQAPATHVMGFNEPDMYGPSCNGDLAQPLYSCKKGEWRAATSSGWASLFDPSSAQHYWQQMVNDITQHRVAGGVSHFVSPSMAMGAKPDPARPCVGVDPSKDGATKHCAGWMRQFKDYTMQLDCVDFSGKATNCWDVIDVIQIHNYARNHQDVLGNIRAYYDEFQEDFEGTNGRRRKTLWLTEVAMGSNRVGDITGFIHDLMSASDGLTNRSLYGYVEKVSWFSEWAWDAFPLGGYTPREEESWSSGLFHPFGDLSPLGEAFFGACTAQSPPAPTPAPPPTPPPAPTPLPAPAPPTPAPPRVVCRRRASADPQAISAAVSWACDVGVRGHVDCGPVNSGGACFDPETLGAHADWVFNAYYEAHPEAGSCDFGGAAELAPCATVATACAACPSSG